MTSVKSNYFYLRTVDDCITTFNITAPTPTINIYNNRSISFLMLISHPPAIVCE